MCKNDPYDMMMDAPPDSLCVVIGWQCGYAVNIESTVDGDMFVDCGHCFDVAVPLVYLLPYNMPFSARCPKCNSELNTEWDEWGIVGVIDTDKE